jgi:Domain of unknown function (DUF4399)
MRTFIIAALIIATSLSFAQERTPSPAGAEVYIVSPKNGAKVKGPVVVVFGLKGMGVAPAGVKFENTGHHHLLVDMDVPADLAAAMPATDTLLHFGKGQTQTSLNLAPGKHTLQLVFADLNHIAMNPPLVSKKITITVVQ